MKLARSFSIYMLSSVAAAAVPLLLLPLLTRELTESEYGIIAALTTLVTFVSPPLFWGVTGAVSVEYTRLSRDRFSLYFSSALRLPLASFAVLMGGTAIAAPLLSKDFGVPTAWFMSVPVFALLSLFPQLLSAILRMRDQAAAYGYFEFFSAGLAVVLSLLLVIVCGLHWQGRMLALAGTYGVTTAIALVWLLREGYLVRAFSRPDFHDAFKFGAGLVPHDLGNQAIRVADRLFLVAMVGLAGTGQYAVASQIASVMLVVLSAFNRAWAPYLFAQLRAEGTETRKAIVRKSYLVICCALLFFVAFNAAVPLAYRLFVDAKFHPSMSYVLWLTLGYLFMAVYMTYIDYIFYVKKTHVLSVITLFNLACNLGLNYLFIGRFGAIGAAYAFAATMFVVMLLAFFLSNRLHPMPWFYWLRSNT